MKKLIIVLGIAVSMYLASESVANPQIFKEIPEDSSHLITEEAQRILDEGRWGQFKGAINRTDEQIIVDEISGEVLVSDLTVSQLNAILTVVVKNTLRDCKTTAMYAYASSSAGKWTGRLLNDSDFGFDDEEHYITCD